jgi:NADH:ubiquinone oxidoreductase subunit F (NADH-binding)
MYISVTALEVARRLAAYNAAESCGKGTPCREGTPRIVENLDRLASGSGAASLSGLGPDGLRVN